MPKKANKTNVSRAIRDVYMKSKGRARPRHIVATLKEQGISVDPKYVSTILSNFRRKKGKRRRMAAQVEMAQPVATNGLSIESLRLAKKLVNAAGGTKAAKKMVDAFNEIMA